MRLDVVVAPVFLEEQPKGRCLCAVVDVLRATSTIVTALVSGATAVHPCMDIDEARRGAASLGRGSGLLGGEERGEQIPGFDLGNSPLEYLAPEVVAEKTIFHYTTNGTGTIRRAHTACGGPVFIASLLNVSAASGAIGAEALASDAEGIVVVCSGRDGKPSAEDLYCAGVMVDNLARGLRDGGTAPQLGDGAAIAAGYAAGSLGGSFDVLATSEHGRFLESIGFAADLEFASRVDEYDVAPVFDGERVFLQPR